MVRRIERGDESVVTGHSFASASPEGMDPASIEIRPLATPKERDACVELQRSTWGDDFSDVIPASILKVSQRIGGVALGAFDRDGALLGFVFGLTGVERGRVVHWSDMLAVAPRARNLGLGRRLKEEQRQTVRQLGADVIYWTYDPSVARNAHLNFNRLGVRLAEYVEDMYGITDSVLHGGIATDRVIVAWPTHDAEISAAARRGGQWGRAPTAGSLRSRPAIGSTGGGCGHSAVLHSRGGPAQRRSVAASLAARSGRLALRGSTPDQWGLTAG